MVPPPLTEAFSPLCQYMTDVLPRLGDVQHETAPVIARLLDEAYWVYFNWSHWSLLSSQHPWGGCLKYHNKLC